MLQKNRYFDVFKPLLAEMTRHDPSARPHIEEALVQFERLRNSLTSGALRSRVVYKGESGIPKLYRASLSLRGHAHRDFIALHKKYGNIVRVAPNELYITLPDPRPSGSYLILN